MVLAHADKAFRKLRKTLRRLPDPPSIEEVHDLRTQTRQFQAVAATLDLGGHRGTRRLIKTIKLVGKASGAVRDMDVLAEDASILSRECNGGQRDESSILRVLHSLHLDRIQKARKLTDVVKKRRKFALKELKRLSGVFKERYRGNNHRAEKVAIVRDGETVTNLLLELRLWPELSEENLHPFRLKVKRLRILLQMAGGADSRISADLGKTKDRIGDWHDWRELREIAKKILKTNRDQAVLKQIQETTEHKLVAAMASAESLLNAHIRFTARKKTA